ncbi:RDD family protein [Flavobacterium praedii]|uniref:RDD family protein n=1 Tax=Flavobacterium praedii TaxID=3002900 RepID=UPI002481B913|nr:RDD family protein [Flavobacterium praedii]
MHNNTYYLDDKLIVSSGKRFLNYIIDIIFYVIIIFLISFVVAIIAALLGLTDLLYWMENMSDMQSNLIAIVVMFTYYIITEGIFGRSLAKFITGTIVVDEYGEKPSFSDILKRTFCRLIPFDAFSYLGNSGRGWHDSISDTYVVDKKELENSLKMFYELDQIGEQSE